MEYNAGFLLVHPTERSKNVYRRMKSMVEQKTSLDDQRQFNIVVSEEKKNKKNPLRIRFLPYQDYMCGKYYYQNRYFEDTMLPCPRCIVVHNNFIVSIAAKVYRAKELHHWMYNGDQYYTSKTRKYMTYDNILPFEAPLSTQLTTLKAALTLSVILNRTLILPKFQCQNVKSEVVTECPLNSIANIESFDKAFAYREHSFLTHPLVPEVIKSSVVHVTFNMRKKSHRHREMGHNSVFTPMNIQYEITEEEILSNFGHLKQSVLVFGTLLGADIRFTYDTANFMWEEKCNRSIVKDSYNQVPLNLMKIRHKRIISSRTQNHRARILSKQLKHI